jgi:hypothetical protein
MAHARRKFDEALSNDRVQAEKLLLEHSKIDKREALSISTVEQ